MVVIVGAHVLSPHSCLLLRKAFGPSLKAVVTVTVFLALIHNSTILQSNGWISVLGTAETPDTQDGQAKREGHQHTQHLQGQLQRTVCSKRTSQWFHLCRHMHYAQAVSNDSHTNHAD